MRGNYKPRDLDARARNYGLVRRTLRNDVPRLVPILQLDINGLLFGDHFVAELPSSTLAQFRNHDITVAKQVYIEIDVCTRLGNNEQTSTSGLAG